VRRALSDRPILALALATTIAGLAVIGLAHLTGARAIGRAFADVDPGWLGLVAGASLLTYPAYILAYRSLAAVHGHQPLALPLVSRIVVAGFGPFALAGGFGIDKRVLEAIHSDERSARVRVTALGTLEWAVLAPVACVTSIVLLVQRANIMASLLWPWAIAVPLGFGFGLWASGQARCVWIRRVGHGRLELLAQTLEGVAVLRTLIARPRHFAAAWLGTAVYWAADIGAFYGGLRVFGLDPGFGRVIIAYATGYAATRRSLPLGGAGLTEFLMTYSLYWVREPLAASLGAVLAYRAFNFVLVAAPAVIAYGQLEPVLHRAGRGRRRSSRR
jgi:uncharacterized membrane protein YbhN (UPF0104 family)